MKNIKINYSLLAKEKYKIKMKKENYKKKTT